MTIDDAPAAPEEGPGVRAAGGVLWRPGSPRVEVALVHRPKYDDWSLPKGKLAAGEQPVDAARREVEEETGFRPVVGPRLPSRSYITGTTRKTVDYWAMRAADGAFSPTREVDQLVWLPPEDALQRLSYPGDADVLDSLPTVPAGTVVVLVRHGQAGDPDEWAGEDRLRPLDGAGRREAEALRQALPAFGVARVVSADPVRCVDTLAPLAADLGVPVEADPTLGEAEYAGSPDSGLRRIRDLGDPVCAVCSQGAVIRGLVTSLAGEDGVTLHKVRSKKGSVWALFFSGRRLTAADYYPTLGSRTVRGGW